MRKIALLVILLSPAIVVAQNYLAKNEYFFTTTNRLDMLVIEATFVEVSTLGVTVKGTKIELN